MKKNHLAIVPFPLDKARKITRHFLRFGEGVSHFFPGMEFELDQAEFDFEPREWTALAIFTGLFYFLMIFTSMFAITAAAGLHPANTLPLTFMVSLVIGATSFIYIAVYPKMFVSRKTRNIERFMPFALRHLLIEVRSGVPLYNSLVSVSKGKYGILSEEIQKAVNEINTGMSEISALETLARNNPSLHFRRVMWQLVNALKSGADIGKTIKRIVENITADQSIAIKKYGAQLNPLALMYMIFAVIFPTLGITFMLIISTFIGIGLDIQVVLIMILVFLLAFQFMLIGLIKNRRPAGV
ncbi:MAG: type II secretion system F family protein [Candidatus Aenigmarchaeota archaeon]|nr:type II secretion system F family protein [Candidatus Aenigmarchaeota archaeon]